MNPALPILVAAACGAAFVAAFAEQKPDTKDQQPSAAEITLGRKENMLIIRGSQRAADIYLGEFMRLFNHYYFRSYQQRQQAHPESKTYQSIYLDPDDSWTKVYYQPGSNREKERLLFR